MISIYKILTLCTMKRILVFVSIILCNWQDPVLAQNEKFNRLPAKGYPPKLPHPCEQSSCYPATGNLIIGRADRLYASSTCGLKGQERFCIVSHLKDRKKCFFCDASNPKYQHNITNIVSGVPHRTWWQAENGVVNVTIGVDFENEFHFTHLIITFKTFRPASMYIERSYDFGKTWKVYRYFALNCEQAFPGIPTQSPRNLNDVICESRYSHVEPSTGGEVIYRALSSSNTIDNPYSKEVQTHLKITNLRIQFTGLHTLGDDLLDDRKEIREKYYYGIQKMIIRGSCFCYGHASRCLPTSNRTSYPEDMVHGKCDCNHNTKGLNCEVCKDFYNDVPWRPAVGKQTNACKPCNCNNHSKSCHFDPVAYEKSGRVSGGFCDNCQHNTMGQNCEQCKPFYYHDPAKDISDPNACLPCDCDLGGSLDDGICDSRTDPLSDDVSGRCHCKTNVEGRRCDRCKNGYWNFDPDNIEGCQECTCNTLGTIHNQGCNMTTGDCTCKKYVTGRDCDQCMPNYWGLSDDYEGCKPCDCDLGGSYESSCDAITGQCRCRPHLTGRTCNQPDQSYYTGSIDFLTYEGEHAGGSENCQIVIREPFRDGKNNTWTGYGFMKAVKGSHLNFTIDNIRKSMMYDIVIRYEPIYPGLWEDVKIDIIRDGPIDQNGPCASNALTDNLVVSLPANDKSAQAYPSVCFEAGKTYNVILTFIKDAQSNPTESVLIDSIVLKPRIDHIPFFVGSEPALLRKKEYERLRCHEQFNSVGSYSKDVIEICKNYYNSIGSYVFEGAHACECDPTGSISLLCQNYGGVCPCKPNVVGRRCDRCAPGTYGFGSEGCKPCDCDGVGALDNFCDVNTGRCKCKAKTYGRTCGQCEPGFWNFPNCERCECNGHAETCDSNTGKCIDCRDFTTGHHCDRCIDTFYGDPNIKVNIPCRPCPCPGSIESGNSHANSCFLNTTSQDVICNCFEEYAGSRCETCAENYYGNPEEPGGSCQACDCNSNVDLSVPGNCDPKTGHCLQCLYNTDGPHCEVCKPNHHGNALIQSCTECHCHPLGTNKTAGYCDHRTGQCPCLPHIIGKLCDSCEKDHWKIASGVGCVPCECDSVGSISTECDEYDGSCQCKAGFGGRRCNECQANYWGDPNDQCYPCACDSMGSASQQCDRKTGVCFCHEGIGGDKCNQCDRGYTGYALECSPCGECFNNWDAILKELKNKTDNVIEEASRIQKVGTTGVYSREFNDMNESLNQVRDLINNATVRGQDLDELNELANNLNKTVVTSTNLLKNVSEALEEVSDQVTITNSNLNNLKNRTEDLHKKIRELEEDANKLQEANVQGALTVTLRMAEQSRTAEKMAFNDTKIILDEADRFKKNTEMLIFKHTESVNETQKRNEESLKKLNQTLESLEKVIPNLNLEMCGANVTDCSDVCGGAGCGFCGQLSCNEGAITKAKQALRAADQYAQKIKVSRDKADQLLKDMTDLKQSSTIARENAESAFNTASLAANWSGELLKNLTDVNMRIVATLTEDHTTPAMVRNLAEQVLNQTIEQMQPDIISQMAKEIRAKVDSLTDSEKILSETKDDLDQALKLEDQAKEAKNVAEMHQSRVRQVSQTLQETQEDQEEASDAIRQAENDIASAEKDLSEIAITIQGAQTQANEETKHVKDLDAALKLLQTQTAKNAFIVKNEISTETSRIKEESVKVEQDTKELEQEYEQARTGLDNRVNKSKGTILRTKKLLQRASELTADTLTKSKDLDGMESVYQDNESTLLKLEQEIKSLTEEMEKHIKEIEEKSQYYRQCSS